MLLATVEPFATGALFFVALIFLVPALLGGLMAHGIYSTKVPPDRRTQFGSIGVFVLGALCGLITLGLVGLTLLAL